MKKHSCLSIIIIALIGITAGYSQNYNQKLEQAAQYHKNYSFLEAAQIYRSILESRPDSTIVTPADSALNAELNSNLIASENGTNLLKYGLSPKLAAKKTFPLNSFYLYYPGFPDKSWSPIPAEYAKGGNIDAPFNIMQSSPQAKAMVFSAQDENGVWSIMFSVRLNDTIWSAPQIANENITTAGNEILPHLSPCGKKLYFASNGHSGMGGYDLYVSLWNEETSDWDTAQNLGFPYSSTANDYLYYDTPCGNFTIFSSDRETSNNEVTTYVTIAEVMPLKQEIPQNEATARANFTFSTKKVSSADNQGVQNHSTVSQPEQKKYLEAVGKIKQKEAMLQKAMELVQKIRNDYAVADSITRITIEKHLQKHEQETFVLVYDINSSTLEIQQMELGMIEKGIEIPAFTPSAPATKKQETAKSVAFSFANNHIGKAPNVIFEKIEPTIDLSFKIEQQAYIADLSEIPQGLIYHIQIMTAPRKASLKALKGFSPVFERKVKSGYTYSVGIFNKYAEAQKNLATVKKKGFPTAMITAYNNGKSISTKQARELEKQDNSIYRVTIGGYETLPSDAITVIRENTSRDIAKANVNGVMKYVIGPFTGKAQAEALATALMAKKITGVEIEKLENK